MAAPPRDESTRRRLDVVLVERGMAATRERAQALIGAGLVEVAGTRATSSSAMVGLDAELRIIGKDHPWASRAGLKLAAALDHFDVPVRDRIALDAGASTGGFVSVLLDRGAHLVYAVDVGRGQLLTDVSTDSRVVVMDGTNLRHLDTLPGDPPSLVTLDLSFISLRKVMPAVAALAPGCDLVTLFKPQFELGREHIGKGGIVRDQDRARESAHEFAQWVVAEFGGIAAAEPLASPVRGTKGNQEWLLHVSGVGGPR